MDDQQMTPQYDQTYASEADRLPDNMKYPDDQAALEHVSYLSISLFL